MPSRHRRSLESRRHKDFTVKEFLELNHLLQTCETGSMAEYGRIQETIAPVALETMAEWVLSRTVGKQ